MADKGEKCTVDGCPNDARPRNPLCWMHVKRRQRGSPPMAEPIQERLTPVQRALEAARRVWDADSEDDAEHDRARRLFEKGLELYAKKGRRVLNRKRSGLTRICPPVDGS